MEIPNKIVKYKFTEQDDSRKFSQEFKSYIMKSIFFFVSVTETLLKFLFFQNIFINFVTKTHLLFSDYNYLSLLQTFLKQSVLDKKIV